MHKKTMLLCTLFMLCNNVQTIMAMNKLESYEKQEEDKQINPIPAFIKTYKKDHPCTGTLCCSSNPEHHEDLILSMRGSSYYACIACQVRPVDVYNTQSFKWDGNCLDTIQSCINIPTYIPKRVLMFATSCCYAGMWYIPDFKLNHPKEYAWDQSHKIDWDNRRIIPKSEQMKRD